MFLFDIFVEMYKLVRDARNSTNVLDGPRADKILAAAEVVLRKHKKDPDNL